MAVRGQISSSGPITRNIHKNGGKYEPTQQGAKVRETRVNPRWVRTRGKLIVRNSFSFSLLHYQTTLSAVTS
jgi:hypothetical protein